MNTSEFCTKMNTTRDTLRYYNETGLLVPDRSSNNYRRYTTADQQTFILIQVLQRAGLSLSEIKFVVDLRRHPVTHQCFDETLKFIQAKIAEFNHQALFFQQLANTTTQLSLALESKNSTKFSTLLESLGDVSDV